ncbi:MAG: PepSY domain-containing protein [Candidatus Accumulibacter sp.]|nr:PepSY domain-containing protein [Accumulibacter sp.]
MKRFTRSAYLVHRWTGIVFGPLVFLWLLSGVVMVFVPRPAMLTAERLAGLPPLVAADVKISPLDAWKSLDRPGWPQAVRLNAGGGRAAYHFLDGARWLSVRADGAGILPPLDEEALRHAVRRYAGDAPAVRFTPVERDQWTLVSYFDPWRPFTRVDLNDGRHYYVSARTGETVLDTTLAERAWNRLGTFIHWLYFTELRQNFELWRGIILWAAFASTLMVASGCYLGIERLKISSPCSGGRFSPYRDTWKRWHHWSGLAGGIFLLAWLVSGWFSLSPMGWASSTRLSETDRQWIRGGAFNAGVLSRAVPLEALGEKTREIRWTGFDGQATLLLFDGEIPRRVVFDGDAPRAENALSLEALVASAKKLMPQNRLVAQDWLNEPDRYYYPRGRRPFRLPVARLRFDDAAESVYYIDPATGDMMAKIDRSGRRQRWLYRGLHRFDFPPFDRFETARKILATGASLLGFFAAISGCVLGWRRIGRPGKRRERG